MSYILGNEKKYQGCIFEATPDQTYDRDKLVLFRDNTTVVLLNRFPYANGHLLVAPARHVSGLEDLTDEEAAHLIGLVRSSTAILKNHLRPNGFNVGLNLGEVAGAGIADHLHFHIIPRWHGDHNFMTTVSEIRTIPEHIDQTFSRLLDDFQSLIDPQAA